MNYSIVPWLFYLHKVRQTSAGYSTRNVPLKALHPTRRDLCDSVWPFCGYAGRNKVRADASQDPCVDFQMLEIVIVHPRLKLPQWSSQSTFAIPWTRHASPAVWHPLDLKEHLYHHDFWIVLKVNQLWHLWQEWIKDCHVSLTQHTTRCWILRNSRLNTFNG